MSMETEKQNVAVRPRVQVDRMAPAGPRNRRAFTLVELLVVISILAMLAALLTPAVVNALKSAREAGVKAEIDMLHMAVTGYAADNNGALPPSYGGVEPSSAYPIEENINARLHVFRLFPRMEAWKKNNPTSWRDSEIACLLDGPDNDRHRSLNLSVDNALVVWLQGYTRNERAPVSQGPRTKYYDFDKSRVNALWQYHPRGRPNSPYIYIDSTQYGQNFTVSVVTYSAVKDETGNYFNPDTFQILCAGTDGQWDTEDDLSNFWPGNRRQYLDSLKK